MSALSAFLNPTVTSEEKEVIISKRFLDEKGKPVPFKIRALTQEENAACLKAATRNIKVKVGYQENLDSNEYNNRLIVAATVSPDFTSAEVCDHFGTKDPISVPGKMLLAGEFINLLSAIQELSGFEQSLDDEAKN